MAWKCKISTESLGRAVFVPLLYADTESVISWTGYIVVQAVFSISVLLAIEHKRIAWDLPEGGDENTRKRGKSVTHQVPKNNNNNGALHSLHCSSCPTNRGIARAKEFWNFTENLSRNSAETQNWNKMLNIYIYIYIHEVRGKSFYK